MNFGRGWNPNLEGSYIPEYRESKAKFWIQCKSGFYIQLLQFSTLDPSPISGYSECNKTQQFQYLGFFQLRVKLGFDFLGVSPNQKSRPRSLNLDFDEERNPMLGSLKNSSYVRSPNFPHQKLKISGIKFRFDRKMRPSMESQSRLLFLNDHGQRHKKIRSPRFFSCTMSSFRVALIPC